MANEVLLVKAEDTDNCDLLSSLLQDSIFHISCHSFHDDKRCLRLMLNRFCWESIDDFEQNQCYFRVHSGLYIHNVDSIVVNDNFKNINEKFLNLLTMHTTKNEVNLVFSDHKHVCVRIDKIQIYLKDLHDKYPTLTRPVHDALRT
ncbi:MAG: DUF2948 family protein [Holosporaceae bacterium]|jgi:hypothetical protein|nr:DUF2948 family protein [Holosporaceae bacterium]